MADSNKVKFGLKNLHYSLITETTSTAGVTTTTYGTPTAWKGATKLSASPEFIEIVFYADDANYYASNKVTKYTGSLECALVPDDVLINVFCQSTDSKNILFESANDTTKYVALLFEVDGDKKARRNVFYKCLLKKPSTEAETIGESSDPKVDTVEFTMFPRADADALFKACSTADTDPTSYASWFTTVVTPTT